MTAVAERGDTFDLGNVSWVWDEMSVEYLLTAIETAHGPIVYDLETTGLHEHAVSGGSMNEGVAARVVLASFTIPEYDDMGAAMGEPTTWILPLSHPDSPLLGQWSGQLTRVAKAMVGKYLVGHNIKFDCRWMKAMTGVDLASSIGWDTQISSHLLDEVASTKLKERAPDTFGIPPWDDVELSGAGAAEREPLFKLGEYAARDTYWTWRLFENHRARMVPMDGEYPEDVEEARLGLLARHCAMPTTATLTAIEQRGLMLDGDWVREVVADNEKSRDEAYGWLTSRYSDIDPEGASFAPTSTWFRAWTERAVEAGDLRVASLTPSGKPQWSKEVLNKQARQGSEVAAQLLRYRNAVKRLEFLRSWLSLQAPDGRIYTNYNAGSVVSGRLSSSGPNMQQVTKALRPAFVPSPGHYIVDLDYSQIELRVAAYISRSVPMIEAFKRGDDLHTIIAAQINGKPMEEVTPEERQAGKAANFGLLYGMGAVGFQAYADTVYGVQFTEQEALKVHRTFFETWDGLRQWHSKMMQTVDRRGFVVSPIGRIRRLEHLAWDANDKMVSFAQRAGINSPVQGFASDIMQIAAACIEGNIYGVEPVEGARLVGTVHDSILVEVPIETWESTASACKRAMEEMVPEVLERMGCEFDVPLKADAVVSTRWGLDDIGEI